MKMASTVDVRTKRYIYDQTGEPPIPIGTVKSVDSDLAAFWVSRGLAEYVKPVATKVFLKGRSSAPPPAPKMEPPPANPNPPAVTPPTPGE